MYWMNLIRKSGRTELVLNIRDLPQDMQDALNAAGMGSEEVGILGAFHPETNNVYIFLPEFARHIRVTQPNVNLDSPRAERLIINRLLNTIQHENLHLVMDKDIRAFAKSRTEEFVEELVIPQTTEFIMNESEDMESNVIGHMTAATMRPMLKHLLENTGKHLIHEIMVRMVMSYDNKKIIDDITPYLRDFIRNMFSNFAEMHIPVRRLLENHPTQQELIDGLMHVLMNSLPTFWGNLMKDLFLRNSELIGDFLTWNMQAVMDE